LQAAVRACSAGGKVVLVGMGDEVMKLDMTHACTHEIDLVGSFRYANTVRAPLLALAMSWLGSAPPKPVLLRCMPYSASSDVQDPPH
jgi:L-iditol 2-dehydrogenase